MPRRGIELTEDQWARVKSHAATRRQTISQFLSDVVDDILPDGQVRPATKAFVPTAEPGDFSGHTTFNSKPFTPAPKPGRKK